MIELLKFLWSIVVDFFNIFGIDIGKLLLLIVAASFFILVVPSFSRSVAARTSGRLTRSINKATTPFYGKKGTGIYKSPSRTVKNKVYRSRSKKLF